MSEKIKSVKIKEIMEYMERLAPEKLKESWDNVGLLVGWEENYTENVLFALDVNDEVIDEAVLNKCGLIITHHPVIFGSIKSVSSCTASGRRIIKLIKNDISVFSAHTNFDICSNGTNTTLAKLMCLENIENLCPAVFENEALGKTGILKNEMKFIDFAHKLKSILNIPHITICGGKDRIIKKVGLCTGSGAGRELISYAAEAGCDVYVTGDVKFHDAQYAADLGICLVDATHYATEAVSLKTMADYISQNSGVNCIISKTDGQTLNIV